MHEKVGRAVERQKQEEKNNFEIFHSELLGEQSALPLFKELAQGVEGEGDRRADV